MTGKGGASKRDVLKPLELLGLSGTFALFVGLIVLMTTRDLTLAGISFGIVFVISLVVIALFVLSIKPGEIERADLDEQDGTEEGDAGPLHPRGGHS